MQRSAVLALQLTRAMENKQISCCQLTRAKKMQSILLLFGLKTQTAHGARVAFSYLAITQKIVVF